MCSFFVVAFTSEGIVAKGIMHVVATDTRCVGRINWNHWKSEFPTNAEEESQWGESVFDGASRHCNE